jgi:hypothetical protein
VPAHGFLPGCNVTEPRISGITVADLARDGILIIEALGKANRQA